MRTWAPMFAIQLGVSRDQMVEMSVPEMVDHVDYWFELNRGGNGN